MPKPFLTYPQQIQKLKDKNLTITDDAAATITLHHYGYFALISGYKDLFKIPRQKITATERRWMILLRSIVSMNSFGNSRCAICCKWSDTSALRIRMRFAVSLERVRTVIWTQITIISWGV